MPLLLPHFFAKTDIPTKKNLLRLEYLFPSYHTFWKFAIEKLYFFMEIFIKACIYKYWNRIFCTSFYIGGIFYGF